MALIEGAIIIDKTLAVPVYLQVSNGIINYIRQGVLKPGSPLPASRILAKTLQVHRQTIVSAYDELYAQSWVDIYPKKGVFVSKKLPDISPRSITAAIQKHSLSAKTLFPVPDKIKVSHLFERAATGNLFFNDGFPDTRIAPVELLIREYRRFANYRFTHAYLMYGPEQGSQNLRNELAHFLSATRGLHVTADDILITKGVQMAIYLTAQILLSENDVVIVGEPGYTYRLYDSAEKLLVTGYTTPEIN
ncbi:MAG TPA: aminotransferase class I/II-fold pyridoxal phosphate-dependent enzyme [Puia sp.]|nr:aminotransferase class I/II-fold pyridoxal phosphate-dependent enzyme [Puia sp.]